MALHLRDWSSIPEMTACVARTCFLKANPYMKMRDELGVLYLDTDFITLFRADCGQSALSPRQLALINVMQFTEGLTDRQAAEAVRSRRVLAAIWTVSRYRRKKSRRNDQLTLNRFANSLCVPSLFCHALSIFYRKSIEYTAISK